MRLPLRRRHCIAICRLPRRALRRSIRAAAAIFGCAALPQLPPCRSRRPPLIIIPASAAAAGTALPHSTPGHSAPRLPFAAGVPTAGSGIPASTPSPAAFSRIYSFRRRVSGIARHHSATAPSPVSRHQHRLRACAGASARPGRAPAPHCRVLFGPAALLPLSHYIAAAGIMQVRHCHNYAGRVSSATPGRIGAGPARRGPSSAGHGCRATGPSGRRRPPGLPPRRRRAGVRPCRAAAPGIRRRPAPAAAGAGRARRRARARSADYFATHSTPHY